MDLVVRNVIQLLNVFIILINIRGFIATEEDVINLRYVHFSITNKKEIMLRKCVIIIENQLRIRSMI